MIIFGRHLIIKLSYILIDVAFLALSIYLACLTRPTTIPFEVTLNNLFVDPINPFRFIFVCWVVITIILNHTHGLYQTKREIFESIEIWEVVKSVALSTLFIIVGIYLLKIEGFPRSILALVIILMCSFLSLWRVAKRIFVNYLVSQGYNNFNALIIGAGKVGVALSQQIQRRPGLGVRIVGFLDDFKETKDIAGQPPVLGKLSDFVKIAREEFVDKIFITIHHDSKVFLSLLREARDLGIRVRVVPQGYELMTREFTKYNIGFIPILEYSNYERFGRQPIKRLFDMLVTFLAGIILLPVFTFIAIMIKLDNPGPVFYLSRRYGRGGRMFNMIKFRSMVVDADKEQGKLKQHNEVDGPIFKIKNDPRITSVGRLLRKYSLDELPQLFNVLKGDMSLVGPRPLPIDQIEKEDIRQLKRLEVRPGITGLWQIKGRSDISFERMVTWDIWYIDNWSFWLDISIIFQTIPVVINGRGAY